MERILQSKLYKGSARQAKILASISDPINKPLVQQLTSFIDGKEVTSEPKVSAPEESKNSAPVETTPTEPSAPAPSHSAPAHFSPSPSSFSDSDTLNFTSGSVDDFDESSNEGVEEPEVAATETEQEPEHEEVAESTNILSSTYVTIETVSHAVNEIPGMLNLRDDTCGVTHAAIKGGSDNEFWIYYNSDLDINSVLEKVNLVLTEAGYYFFEFNRVSRDSNAIVFSINWVSNYFRPSQIKDTSNEG